MAVKLRKGMDQSGSPVCGMLMNHPDYPWGKNGCMSQEEVEGEWKKEEK